MQLWGQHQCDCFNGSAENVRATPTFFHSDTQDENAGGWRQLLELIEMAASESWEEFAPLAEMTLEARSQVITLPRTIVKLKSVRRLELCGSNLVRIPSEIGEMKNLEEFDPYSSERLHWFPYEITRCATLVDSRVSTRCLYGNYKFRPPFPQLEPPLNGTDGLDVTNLPPRRFGAIRVTHCSVCRSAIAGVGLHQAWISLLVGTDVLPLLVNACSAACLANLPSAASGYVTGPHGGGLSLQQPRPDHG